MWNLILSLFENGHAKFWGTIGMVAFLAGGSCTSLHWRLQTHEKQSGQTVKILKTICTHQAKTVSQATECLED